MMRSIEASEHQDELVDDSISKGFDVCLILEHRIHDLPEVHIRINNMTLSNNLHYHDFKSHIRVPRELYHILLASPYLFRIYALLFIKE